ncbi:PAS domain S-box protein [Roseomonas xinghualingensis]|uniref:PAS domain S-box protein n=1 Tax=Roseomonas xinghualingensis TaxID=2986475 RepID=UPI0021F105D8|nr:PAS domain S-box protein [Roseomonas sp. SXEYE001]MCV4206250.1 PAS domain S-box protein [Roseomonas sp. SXEYE001]
MSLLSRLLSLVGLALLPALAALVWGALEAGRAREIAAQEDAQRLVRLVATDHQRLSDGARQLLTSLGNLRAVRVLDQEECQSFFQRIMADFPRYVLLATATLDGRVVCSAQPSAHGNNIGDRDYFHRAIAENGFVVGGHVLGRASGEASFHFAQPFYDNAGGMAGVVHASVGLDWLAEQIGRVPLPPNAVLSIVDRSGIVLATRPGRGQTVGAPIQGQVRTFLGRPTEGVEVAMGMDGIRRTYAYIPASASGTHSVVLGFDHAAALADASKVQRQGALVLLGTTLVALGLTVFGAGSLVRRPVGRLLEAAERWREGDTSARVPHLEGGRSEFDRLAAAFNAMAEAMEARERSLRESEAEFRAIFETAAVGVVQLDLRHSRVERVNRRLCEILDYAEEELVGRSPFEHVPPEDAASHKQGLARLAATGQSTSEYRAIRGDGSMLWLRVSSSVSEWSDGKAIRAVAVLQDITGQRLAEEANARLAAIVTSAADAIISLSGEDGRIVTWNKGAETLFGYSGAEAVGQGTELIVPPEGNEGSLYRRALAGETIRDHETIRVAKDGERIPVAATMTRMLAADGRMIGISVILRDLRERRAADQQQQLLMREIDHRAKNVMAVVRSLVQLSPKDDPVEFGRAIEGRISAMARAHSLLARDRWEGASLRDLFEEELGGRLQGRYGPGQADLDGPSVILRPDTVQPLSMVLHELVTNSTKYGALSRREGRVSLRWWLEADPREAGPGLTILWTESGGPPIEAPPKRKGFGSRLIEISVRHQLRGSVSLDWERSGLVVQIRVGAGGIAALGPQAATPAAPLPTPPSAEPDLRGIRVLLAEDEVLVAIEAAESLVAAGCQLLGPTGTLEEGIALAKRAGTIHAAVLDVNLAGRQVIPLADLLVARGVPVLFTTGYGEAPTGHHGAPVLTKPIRPDDLVAAVRQLVGSTPAVA